VDECKPLLRGRRRTTIAALLLNGRGLHSFPYQLNLSSSVHRMMQLNS